MIVLGCSPAGFEHERQARAVMAPIPQVEANALGGECVGVVASVGNVEYRYAQIKAKLYLCDIDGDSPGKLWGVDSVTGAPVDLAQVRADDDAGYMQQGRLQSDLRALLESSSADARHTVDLWLRADLDDAADDKDDATAQAAATQALSSSLRPAADAVLAQVAKLPSVSVKSDKSTFEHLPIPIITIEGSAQDILAIADGPLISHVSPALDQLRDDELFSENYIQSTYINSISGLLGLDGTGITIGNLEGASPDSWANLVPSGPCTSTKCACVHGKTGPHSRTTQGVVSP
ncbi:MAG: hypothetical protein KF718_20915 [Polyangiaceae bacterium]|nr:hypothetical protein [Polyangiaceae bacterium]